MLDTISILIALGVLCCSFSIAMLLIWRFFAPGRPLLLWGYGMGCYGIGTFLASLRDRIPDFFSILAGNLLVFGCYCLVWWGICLYRGDKPFRRTMAASLLLLTATYTWFTYIDHDIAHRIVALRSFIVFCLGGAIASLLKTGQEKLTHMEKAAIAALLTDAVLKLLIVGIQLLHISYSEPLRNNAISSAAAMLSLIGVISWGLAVILMTLEKTVAGMRAAENASSSAKNLLETIIDNIPSLIYLKDLQGRILACNLSVANLFGVSREQIINKTSHDFFPANLADKQHADDKNVLQSGKMLVTDEVLELADGQHVFETTKLAVRNHAGEISSLCGISTDITERRQAETALKESQQLFTTVANTSPALVWMSGLDMGCTWFNETWLNFTGRSVAQEQGNGWSVGVHHDDLDRCLKIYIDSFNARQPFAMQYRLRRHDGEYRWIYDQGQPRYDASGTFCGYIGSCLDVTDQIDANEKLKEKNSEIEQFIYTVSHDLRSPLVTVTSFLGYLEQDMNADDVERIDQDLNFIHAAADKMELLLNELLEMSRIGRRENPATTVTFRELAQEALTTVAGQIAGHNVAVRVADVDLVLTGDRPRLAQIWQNLLDNAVKYLGDQPEPHIELGVEQQGGETVFFVRDNGIGIASEYRNRIFGIFDKLDRSSSGVGLGLAMVKKIVETYNGRIWVDSDGEGCGSCFRFTLPEILPPKGGS